MGKLGSGERKTRVQGLIKSSCFAEGGAGEDTLCLRDRPLYR